MEGKIFSRKRHAFPKIRIAGNGNVFGKKRKIDFSKLKSTNNSINGNYKPGVGNNNSNYQNNKSIKKLLKTAIIVIIAVFSANRMVESIEPTMDVLCVNMAKSMATTISNKQVLDVMENYKYEDIFKVIRDENENVKMIQMDSVTVNKISSSIAINVQNALDTYQKGEFYIKLGSFTGTKILSGRGPNVPIKMSSVGNIETNIKSQFFQAGINQTLHKVDIEIKCNVTILTPFDTIEEEIVTQVPLTEAVIIGDVPSNYYNLEGVSEQDAIQVLQ